MSEKSSLQRLRGANMDIDLVTPEGAIAWEQDLCPWNVAEGGDRTPMRREGHVDLSLLPQR